MNSGEYNTLSQAINTLTKNGYREGFRAGEQHILCSYSDKEFKPEELKIVETFRFEGMSNPQDDTAVFAIEANDGTKGTLVMSHSAEHNQNIELLKRIPNEE